MGRVSDRWKHRLSGAFPGSPRRRIVCRDELAPNGAAELILAVDAARGREIIARIRIGIPQEIESIAVKFIGAGFCQYVDHATTEVTVFRVKVVGNDPELRNGVDIGYDGCAVSHLLLNIAAIHQEAVGVSSRAADRQRSVV